MAVLETAAFSLARRCSDLTELHLRGSPLTHPRVGIREAFHVATPTGQAGSGGDRGRTFRASEENRTPISCLEGRGPAIRRHSQDASSPVVSRPIGHQDHAQRPALRPTALATDGRTYTWWESNPQRTGSEPESSYQLGYRCSFTRTGDGRATRSICSPCGTSLPPRIPTIGSWVRSPPASRLHPDRAPPYVGGWHRGAGS